MTVSSSTRLGARFANPSYLTVGNSGNFLTIQNALDFIATQPQWAEISTSITAGKTASITAGNSILTGTATTFASNNCPPTSFISIGPQTDLNQRKWYPVEKRLTNTTVELGTYAQESVSDSVKLALPLIYTIELLDENSAEQASITAKSLNVRFKGNVIFKGGITWDVGSGIIAVEEIHFQGPDNGVGVTGMLAGATYPQANNTCVQRWRNVFMKFSAMYDGSFLPGCRLYADNMYVETYNHVVSSADLVTGEAIFKNCYFRALGTGAESTTYSGGWSDSGVWAVHNYFGCTFDNHSTGDTTSRFRFSNNANYNSCVFRTSKQGSSNNTITLVFAEDPVTPSGAATMRFNNCIWQVDSNVGVTSITRFYHGVGAAKTVNMYFTDCSFPAGYADTTVGAGTLNIYSVDGLNGYAQSIAYAAAITPDPNKGVKINVGQLTGNITINAPTNPQVGQELTLNYTADATPGRAISYNAVFKTSTVPTSTANGSASHRFVYNGANWVQSGGALVWL